MINVWVGGRVGMWGWGRERRIDEQGYGTKQREKLYFNFAFFRRLNVGFCFHAVPQKKKKNCLRLEKIIVFLWKNLKMWIAGLMFEQIAWDSITELLLSTKSQKNRSLFLYYFLFVCLFSFITGTWKIFIAQMLEN